jgi:Xaa-Pro aminopeptidase
MKADLDRLMEQRGLDAIVVTGGEQYSDVADYMSNGAHTSGGYILKKRGETPLLVVNGMEIEEAKKSGYPCVTTGDLGLYDLLKQYGFKDAGIHFWGKLFHHMNLTSGTVGLYGVDSVHVTIDLYERLKTQYPQFTFKGESGRTLFQEAYLTKDAQEMQRIMSVAERTNAVVQQIWDYIASHRANAEGMVVDAQENVLTVGKVKSFARRALLDVGLEDTHMIFAPGRDGGFPHSRGEDPTPVKVGEAIVFDFFPREQGGGYCHDMTRTWCINTVPPQVQEAFDDVMNAFDIAVESYGLGKGTHTMQEAVLDYFEGKGHPTARSSSNPTEGYTHSLGHGIGLNIHEAPAISHLRKEDTFQIGNVITIEPGLYYPERGFGIRVEDSFYINDNGELISITPFKKDLLLTLEG